MDRWSEALVERLRELWNKGYSASQIAYELNGGFTRNSVIGKLHRLGLSFSDQPTKFGHAPRSYAPRAPRAAKEAVKPTLATKPNFTMPKPLSARSEPIVQHSRCQWPMNEWEPGMGFTAQFCCEPTERGSSYCQAHHAAAWAPSPPRKPVGLQAYDRPRRAA